MAVGAAPGHQQCRNSECKRFHDPPFFWLVSKALADYPRPAAAAIEYCTNLPANSLFGRDVGPIERSQGPDLHGFYSTRTGAPRRHAAMSSTAPPKYAR